MELAPRYCRSCGSRILVKNVCQHCNNQPLSGNNYCYDCGVLTPNADSCLKCGAKYKRNSPAKPMLLIIGTFLIGAISIIWFVTRRNAPALTPVREKQIAATPKVSETIKQELSQTYDTIANNPVDTLSLKINKPIDSSVIKIHKPIDASALKINKPVDTLSMTKPSARDTAKKIVTNIFSSAEKSVYNISCSYFGKNNNSQVLFFIANGSGYIKMNGKIFELKRKSKGVDEAVFGDARHEAMLTINGLSGSKNEWLASCTLIIKNITQHTSIKQKVFSTCIEL